METEEGKYDVMGWPLLLPFPQPPGEISQVVFPYGEVKFFLFLTAHRLSPRGATCDYKPLGKSEAIS